MLTIKENDSKCFLVALALYLPSTVLLPAYTYYLYAPIFLIIILITKNKINNGIFITGVLFLVSLFISLTSFVILGEELNYYGNFIPVQASLLVSLICSIFINEKVAKFLIYMLVFEFFAAVLQYGLGVNTFFPSSFISSTSVFNESSDLLYFKRVFGFNNNSSGLAGNALICFTLMLTYFSHSDLKTKVAINILVFTVLIMTFSRSALVAFISYYLVLSFLIFFSKRVVYLVFVIIIILLFLYFVDIDYFISQFTRNKGSVELTGRPLIWEVYWQSIVSAPLFGNFGFRNYLNIPVYGYYAHAHNSFIMLLYITGIVPMLLILIPLVIQVFKSPKRILCVVSIVVYSFAQYFLFWGASLVDIVFFAALFSSFGGKISLAHSHYEHVGKCDVIK
ncbi:O-antigen polymerase family protein [Oleispira antarctica RB-8]|uniref:O-antigen polymerase family protein n=1 Tax=Oleispira antarctica RB-8 TaxID=698738 RepID=R4YQQ7_OLEAN|nr:O-antigen polymerase family protein [Oleispira antarctica RB-8]